MDASCVFTQDGCDFAGVRRPACSGDFADFDAALERGWVGEAEVVRGDGDGSGDGAEVEDGLVLSDLRQSRESVTYQRASRIMWDCTHLARLAVSSSAAHISPMSSKSPISRSAGLVRRLHGNYE